MRVTGTWALHGPNVWSRHPVFEVALAADRDASPDPHWPDTITRLGRAFDSLTADSATAALSSTISGLNEAVDFSDALWRLLLALQRSASEMVRHGWVGAGGNRSRAACAVEFCDEAVVRRALGLALQVLELAERDRPLPLAGMLAELRTLAADKRLGRTTGPLVAMAKLRGVPTLRLDDENLVQLGYGCRQRRLSAAVTDRAGYLAEGVSRNKFLTKQLLARVGIPVPVGRLVDDAATAWQAACELGLPAAMKPLDADYGNGVSLRLVTQAEFSAAFDRARQYGARAIVEQFLPGAHHRLLVIGKRVVAALRRDPAAVVGDGRSSVRKLLAVANGDPRRGPAEDRSTPLFKIDVDEETERSLADQGLDLDALPAAGQQVLTRWRTAEWNGDSLVDVTDDVHPEIAALAIDAVRVVGLDLAGVDLIADDISRPPYRQQLGVLEVNAEPSILIHASPVCQPPRPVTDAIVTHLFPQAEQARIPIVAVCGGEQTSIVRWLARGLNRAGYLVGTSDQAGTTVQGRNLLLSGGATAAARALLLHPRVEAAVCRLSSADLRTAGLAFDRCDVALFMELDGANSEADEFSQLEHLRAARVLADSVSARQSIVVNVDDPACAELFQQLGGRAVAVSLDREHAAIERSRACGGRAAFLVDDAVVLAEGPAEFRWQPRWSPLQAASTIGTARAWLATVAAAWVLQLDLRHFDEPACAEPHASVSLR